MEIDEVIIFIAENPDGEGIVAFELADNKVTAVTTDQLIADKIEEHIKKNADINRPQIKIVRFKKVDTIRYI